MPRPLTRPVRPLKSRETTPSLYLLTPPMSMPSNVALTPNCSDSRAESATSAACSSALVGMQPTCRQVPPSLPFSTRATDRPSCGGAQGAGVAAAARPEDHHVEAVAGADVRHPCLRSLVRSRGRSHLSLSMRAIFAPSAEVSTPGRAGPCPSGASRAPAVARVSAKPQSRRAHWGHGLDGPAAPARRHADAPPGAVGRRDDRARVRRRRRGSTCASSPPPGAASRASSSRARRSATSP